METATDTIVFTSAFCVAPLLLVAAITCLIIGLVRKSRSWKRAAGVVGVISVLTFGIPMVRIGGQFAEEMGSMTSAQLIQIPGTPGHLEAPHFLEQRSTGGRAGVAISLQNLLREGMVAVLVTTPAEAAVTDDPASFKSYVDAIATGTAKAMGGPPEVALEPATFNGLPAFRYTFDGTDAASGDKLVHLGCVIRGGDHLYQFVCETRAGRKAEWSEILEGMLVSFSEEESTPDPVQEP
jgi:hypothetical protein